MGVWRCAIRQASLQIVSALLFAFGLVGCTVSEPLEEATPLESQAVTVGYTRHYGTAVNDLLTGLATDAAGNTYTAGHSETQDTRNTFLRKYSPDGTLLWEKRTEVPSWYTSLSGLTLDKNGNVYVVGDAVNFTTHVYYIYLEKVDPAGNSVWRRQIRAEPASDPTHMIANGIATDPRGNNFIVILFERAFYPYQTRQVYIRKYKASGRLLWEKPVGTSSPYAARPSLATDKTGNVYTAINTVGFQRWNSYLDKFDVEGHPVWSTVLFPNPPYENGSSSLTYVHGLTVDSAENLYVTGITAGSLEGTNLGSYDAFVRKFDSSSNVLWTRQFGTTNTDYANAVTTDTSGNVYIAGSSTGSLQTTNLGSYDAYVRKYDASGTALLTRQFGTTEFDIGNTIKVNVVGNVYIGGNTFGNLGGKNQGGADVYFRTYTAFQ
jgi:hypothetical protein